MPIRHSLSHDNLGGFGGSTTDSLPPVSSLGLSDAELANLPTTAPHSPTASELSRTELYASSTFSTPEKAAPTSSTSQMESKQTSVQQNPFLLPPNTSKSDNPGTDTGKTATENPFEL